MQNRHWKIRASACVQSGQSGQSAQPAIFTSHGKRADKFMPRNSKIAKEPYTPPSLVVLDANAAKAKLQANGNPKDPDTQRMLSLIDEE